MDEFEKAVYANATPEEITQAVAKMPDEHKGQVVTATIAGMPDKQLDHTAGGMSEEDIAKMRADDRRCKSETEVRDGHELTEAHAEGGHEPMDANEAIKRLEEMTAEAARIAQEELDRGVHPEAVALGLLAMSDGLPDGVKVAQIGALSAGLSYEALKKLPPELLARILAAHQNPAAAPPPNTPIKPKET